MQKRGLADSAACECGEPEQTADHIINSCPLHRPPSEDELFEVGPLTRAWLQQTELIIWDDDIRKKKKGEGEYLLPWATCVVEFIAVGRLVWPAPSQDLRHFTFKRIRKNLQKIANSCTLLQVLGWLVAKTNFSSFVSSVRTNPTLPGNYSCQIFRVDWENNQLLLPWDIQTWISEQY